MDWNLFIQIKNKGGKIMKLNKADLKERNIKRIICEVMDETYI